MEPSYDVEAWAREAGPGRRIFNRGFRLFGAEMPGWTLVKVVPMHRDEELVETAYLWQRDEAPERALVRVNVAELPDWRSAHAHLRATLDHVMRPDLPGGAGPAAELGDVLFTARARESDLRSSMHFVRGNVVVSVASAGSERVDVHPFAAAVDRLLVAHPSGFDFLAWREHPAAGAGAGVGSAGERPVVAALSGSKGSWLKAIAADGELRRDGDALLYRPGEAGAGDVELFIVGPREKAAEPRQSVSESGRRILLWIGALVVALLLLLLLLGRDRLGL